MRIKIENQVFEKNDFKSLNFFIQLCTFENRYNLFVDITKELKSTYTYERLDIDDRKEIEEQFNSYYQNSIDNSNINYFIVDEELEEKNKFTLNEAIRFFIQPISIILENSKNDAHFLNAIFKYFDENNRILNYIQKGWIQFENAGGCDNIQNFIEGKLQSFNSLPKQNKSSYLKCFVIMDSDKKHQNDSINSKKQETLSFLRTNFIENHILEKRSMENYLPINAYKLDSRFTNWYNDFRSLSNSQKDFFSIEKGLCGYDKNGNPKKSNVEINQETNNLYSNLLIGDIKELNLVNGIKYYRFGDFKEVFPQKFNDSNVNKESLKERTGNDELERIVQKIVHLL